MKHRWRRRLRGLLLIPLFGGIFWATALFASSVPALLVLGVNVHGLRIANYAGDPGGSLAPLSTKILSDVSQDTSNRSALASTTAGSAATASPTAPTPRPTPRPTPAPIPVPTVPPLPSILPTPSPTPVPAPTPTPNRATIGGQVVDSVTQLGIAGAQVTTSSGGSTTTDVNGNFTFGVSAGTHTLTASAIGYSSASQTVTVAGGQTLAVTIKLVSSTATGGIKGSVTNSTTGAALVGAVIALSNGLTTTTDLAGTYSFPVVLSGNYTITAAALGYIREAQPVTVRPGHTTTVDFALAR
jgi:hypothetical protein